MARWSLPPAPAPFRHHWLGPRSSTHRHTKRCYQPRVPCMTFPAISAVQLRPETLRLKRVLALRLWFASRGPSLSLCPATDITRRVHSRASPLEPPLRILGTTREHPVPPTLFLTVSTAFSTSGSQDVAPGTGQSSLGLTSRGSPMHTAEAS